MPNIYRKSTVNIQRNVEKMPDGLAQTLEYKTHKTENANSLSPKLKKLKEEIKLRNA